MEGSEHLVERVVSRRRIIRAGAAIAAVGAVPAVSAQDEAAAHARFTGGSIDPSDDPPRVWVDEGTFPAGGYMSIHTVAERLDEDRDPAERIADSFVGISGYVEGQVSNIPVSIHPSPEDIEELLPFDGETHVDGSALPGVPVEESQPVLAIPHTDESGNGAEAGRFRAMTDGAYGEGQKTVDPALAGRGDGSPVNDLGILFVAGDDEATVAQARTDWQHYRTEYGSGG